MKSLILGLCALVILICTGCTYDVHATIEWRILAGGTITFWYIAKVFVDDKKKGKSMRHKFDLYEMLEPDDEEDLSNYSAFERKYIALSTLWPKEFQYPEKVHEFNLLLLADEDFDEKSEDKLDKIAHKAWNIQKECFQLITVDEKGKITMKDQLIQTIEKKLRPTLAECNTLSAERGGWM